MEEGLPYITAALFCDRVIEGKDGVLSVIRIIERAQIELGTNDPVLLQQKVALGLQITGLICIKAGPLEGKFNIRIEAQKPSGKRADLHVFPIELHGGDTGANLILNLTIAVDEDGTHWFDVFFEDRLLTKIPLTILRGQTQEMSKGDKPLKSD
jgi:hypothetical protein